MKAARTTDRLLGMAVSIAMHACIFVVPSCEATPRLLQVTRIALAATEPGLDEAAMAVLEADMAADREALARVEPVSSEADRDWLNRRGTAAGQVMDGGDELQGRGRLDGGQGDVGVDMGGDEEALPSTRLNATQLDDTLLDPETASKSDDDQGELAPSTDDMGATSGEDLQLVEDSEGEEDVEEDVEEADPEPDDWAEVVLLDEAGERPAVAEAEAAYDYAADRRSRMTSTDEAVATGDLSQEASRAEQIRAERESRAQARNRKALGARQSTGERDAVQDHQEARESAVTSMARRPLSSTGHEGQRAVGESQPSWWSPVATRIPPSMNPTESLASPEDGDVPTQDAAQGMRQTLSYQEQVDRQIERDDKEMEQRKRGADDGIAEDDAFAEDAVAEDGVAAVEEQESETREDAPDEDVSEQDLTPPGSDAQRGSQGVRAAQGGTSSSAFEAEEGGLAINAVKTDRGVWITEVDQVVRAAWRSQSLPMALRGQQVRGDVSVRFIIQVGGRVENIQVVRSSGNEWLDAMAVSAIPKRVPRPPKSLGSDNTVHEIKFRYR